MDGSKHNGFKFRSLEVQVLTNSKGRQSVGLGRGGNNTIHAIGPFGQALIQQGGLSPSCSMVMPRLPGNKEVQATTSGPLAQIQDENDASHNLCGETMLLKIQNTFLPLGNLDSLEDVQDSSQQREPRPVVAQPQNSNFIQAV
ncbi:hypothetical protein VNO78_32278 [Psophocarpus tetragonolobus]|uniref:Uncharacterized protein n=1 Tax=Psophocarpus tetragonolobus TaxID=3891 RepID=A0AAN9P0Q9_PSOTE